MADAGDFADSLKNYDGQSRVRAFDLKLEVVVRPLRDVDWGMLQECIAGRIAAEEPTTMQVLVDQIQFTARFWRFVPSWNLLLGFDSGAVSFDRVNGTMRFVLSFRPLVCFWAVFSLSASIFFAAGTDDLRWLLLNGVMTPAVVAITLFFVQMEIGELSYQAIRTAVRVRQNL